VIMSTVQERFIYVSHKDSLEAFPDNNPSDFTVQLPAELAHIRNGKLALLEIEFSDLDRRTVNNIDQGVIVLCDAIDSLTCISQAELPALRRISFLNAKVKKNIINFSYEFKNPYYIHVKTDCLKYIRIKLDNCKLPITCNVTLLLHLKWF
jgi:hypothetical protein